MRWFKGSIRQSIYGLLGNPVLPSESVLETGTEDIREAMLTLLSAAGSKEFSNVIRRVQVPIDVYLGRHAGGDLLAALALQALWAVLLLAFGLMGARLSGSSALSAPVTVILLCFIMGLQNALVTKLSYGEMRTTHVTGIVTDLGIELGKLFYWNVAIHGDKVVANRARLRLLSSLLAMFFLGGVAGALGFKHIGFVSTIPLALLVFLLAAVPVFDDVWRRVRGRY